MDPSVKAVSRARVKGDAIMAATTSSWLAGGDEGMMPREKLTLAKQRSTYRSDNEKGSRGMTVTRPG
jgi:hypothetical protein